MTKAIRVGMADKKLCRPPESISTLGLGSCIGVVLYDRVGKWCGMAHCMLPDSTLINMNDNRDKFVDTCLDDMYKALLRNGVRQGNLVSKIAGGARMFAYDSINENLNIGARNILAAKKFLSEHHIPIIAEHTGETYGRTIEFFPETGTLMIKAVGIGMFTI